MIEWLLAPLQYSFMVRGLLAAITVGAVCGVLGTYVVLRGMAFFGDALAGLDVGVLRHVRVHEDRLATRVPDEADGLLAPGVRDVTDDDTAAGSGEGEGDRPSHPPCSSGDDR